MSEWHHVYEAARAITPDGRLPVRLANLAIAAQWDDAGLSADSIREAVSALALTPFSPPRSSWRRWEVLASAAATASAALDFDSWTQGFQESDQNRKGRGAYATPRSLATELARVGLGTKATPLRVVDPSAGTGALLLAVLERLLGSEAGSVDPRETVLSLHGIELDPLARELCCLLVWLSAGRIHGVSLAEIAERIVVDNAITREWGNSSFELVIMNPPWESLRHEPPSPELLAARNDVLQRLREPRAGAVDLPPLFSAQGKGDRNLFKLFLELAPHLVGEGGRLALLIPGAFSSDLGLRDLRRLYLDHMSVERWTSFENLEQLFPIDARYKFGVLVAERTGGGTRQLGVRSFATSPLEVHAEHVCLSRNDLDLLGGPSAMLPELTSEREVQLLRKMLSRGEPFFSGTGPLGTVTYTREFDLTLDRAQGLFARTEQLTIAAVSDAGEYRLRDGEVRVPLVEGRMVGQYDFFQKSWVSGSGRTAAWSPNNGQPISRCTPQFLIAPRSSPHPTRIALCDVTSATNTRTVHAAWVPPTWQCGNTAPVLEFTTVQQALAACAILNSLIFDWFARRVVSGLHLNKFYLDTLAWPRLTGVEVNVLAEAAAKLLLARPHTRALRCVDLVRVARSKGAIDEVAELARVEALVARGFGLDTQALQIVFDPDRQLRRGFWRYFDAKPAARTVIAEATALLSREPAIVDQTRRRAPRGSRAKVGKEEQLFMFGPNR